MLKQILSRLPRKSSKSDSAGTPRSNSVNNAVISGNGIQGANGGTAVSGRTNNVKRMSSAVFPAIVVAGIDPIPSLKDVPNAEQQNLFISKLNLCCVVFDFHDPKRDSVEKDLKRQILLELLDFVASGSVRFTEPAIIAMRKMSSVNLFRVFPPSYRCNSSVGETEDQEPMFDPAWSHLQIVYDLLLKFVTSSSLDVKLAKRHIDHSFVLKLLDLFDSEDPRERDSLKTILHRIYGKFMVHRPFIRKAVSNIFYRFIFETERHNGIAELLEVFGSVISGFALPLKEEHKTFLCRALIPLHKPKSVGVYFQQLSYCITQFIEKDAKLVFIQEDSSSDSEDDADMADGQDKRQTMTPPGSGSRKRKRKRRGDVMVEAILEIAAATKVRAAAASQSRDRFSIANCVKALDELQGIESQVYFAALDLFDNPNARETFISLKTDKRLPWLKSKCNLPASS